MRVRNLHIRGSIILFKMIKYWPTLSHIVVRLFIESWQFMSVLSKELSYFIYLFAGTGIWTQGFCNCKAGALPLESHLQLRVRLLWKQKWLGYFNYFKTPFITLDFFLIKAVSRDLREKGCQFSILKTIKLSFNYVRILEVHHSYIPSGLERYH
jgi:hypothetical protein